MTVLRREDVQSNLASWDDSPYRMHNPPILAIVPLIIRRLRGPSLTNRFSFLCPVVRQLLTRLRRAFAVVNHCSCAILDLRGNMVSAALRR